MTDDGVGTPGGDVLDTRRAGGILIRGSILRLVAFGAQVVLSVVSAVVVTRHLGVTRFGQYATVLSLVAVVAAVTDAGMSSYGTREYSIRVEPDRGALMEALIGLRVALTVLGVILIVGFALAAGYDNALLAGSAVAGLSTLPLVFQHTLSIPLSVDLRLGWVALLELGRQALLVGGLVTLVLLGTGVLPLLAVPLLVNVLLIPPTARLARNKLRARLTMSTDRWSEVLRATVVYSVATAVGTIYVYTAQILTSLVVGRFESGLFAISFRIFIVTGGVPGLLVGAALPLLSRAARDDVERLSYALDRIFAAMLVCGVGTALVISSGSDFIVSVVAGPHFAAAGPVLGIQAWAIVASFLIAGWSFGLLSIHEHRGLLVANAAAFAVSVVLTLVLAASEGARGTALATVCGETTLALASLVALVRARPALRPNPLVITKVLLAGGTAALAAFLPDLTSLARAVVAAVVYVVVALVLRAVPAELTELLPRRR